ncbi:hypothetical protein PHLGIDRAFT_502877 [Phlebiopsis gigantea 11061_1 CR5-6]|uniref:Uncharacterized protein n=1 Tax=Phlebiopsis gigantea (strain 11061_1 CR5-6) TaxID=745531 RepID=A0A0C3NWB3_PHLG1|nr:hypothetical protein PHLGIDRAFT_502877 [Phlebiopsis gigantea 11061_1 CR5-6]
MTVESADPRDIIYLPALDSESVPLRTGPPTKEELLVHYPARFTWTQLKTFVNSGDLGLLKRDKKLQVRYETWAVGIREKYGSMVNYLTTYRLQWGQPDRLSLLASSLDGLTAPQDNSNATGTQQVPEPATPPQAPQYFTADIPRELISIIMNDWPYSVPPEIEHALIWTKMPMIPLDLPASVKPRILQDGLWGFTGSTTPPPSPSLVPTFLPALADWGVTMDKLIVSARGTDEEEKLVRGAGKEIETFVKTKWVEHEWETAWFVNPPRLQSVPGLAHAHVFARHKSYEESAAWQLTQDGRGL